MIRNILKMGNPVLRYNSALVQENEIFTKDFKYLIRDLFDTMKKAEGVGLAAPQIGVSKRLFVIGTEKEQDRYENQVIMEYRVVINPEIKFLTDKKEGMWEGCLSIPDMRGFVERPTKIQMKWQDQKWQTHQQIFDGFEAVVCQHEYDHLCGLLYVDRLKDTKLFGFNDSLTLPKK